MKDLIEDAVGNLRLFTPNKGQIWVLFSGGKDSITVAHLASQLPEFGGLVHVRTGTGPLSDEHTARTIEVANSHNWPIIVTEPTDTYASLVIEHGFPGPPAHRWMYIVLKERAIRKAVRVIKQRGVKHFSFATGKRKWESSRRMANGHTVGEKYDGRYWFDPINEWKTPDVLEYIDRHGLVASTGKSQECLCGAFAHPGEREEIRALSQGHAAWLDGLEKLVAMRREHKLLEQRLGRDVTVPEEHTITWGHGIGKSGDTPLDDDRPTICNTCEGQLGADGNVGIDPDKELLRIKEGNG